jgi:hypothetical protein
MWRGQRRSARTGVAEPAQSPMQFAAAALAVHVDFAPYLANAARAYAYAARALLSHRSASVVFMNVPAPGTVRK